LRLREKRECDRNSKEEEKQKENNISLYVWGYVSLISNTSEKTKFLF
jgi:hypothetical protein